MLNKIKKLPREIKGLISGKNKEEELLDRLEHASNDYIKSKLSPEGKELFEAIEDCGEEIVNDIFSTNTALSDSAINSSKASISYTTKAKRNIESKNHDLGETDRRKSNNSDKSCCIIL